MVTNTCKETYLRLSRKQQRRVHLKREETINLIEDILDSEDFEDVMGDFILKIKKMLRRESKAVLEEYLKKNPADRHRPYNLAKAIIYVASRRLYERKKLAPYLTQVEAAATYGGVDEKGLSRIYRKISRILSAQ